MLAPPPATTRVGGVPAAPGLDLTTRTDVLPAQGDCSSGHAQGKLQPTGGDSGQSFFKIKENK